jgi:hypothetical protein
LPLSGHVLHSARRLMIERAGGSCNPFADLSIIL